MGSEAARAARPTDSVERRSASMSKTAPWRIRLFVCVLAWTAAGGTLRASEEIDSAEFDSASIHAEARRLLAVAASPSYEERQAARDELERLAADPNNTTAVLEATLAALAACRDDDWRTYDLVWRAVWERWLVAAPPEATFESLPTESQLDAELLAMSAPAADGDAAQRAALAERRFRSWVVQAPLLPRIRRRLDALSGEAADFATAAALEATARDVAPTLCAEIWHDERSGAGLRHRTAQFLTIGVPQYPDRAIRSTFFSAADEQTATLVEGNTLAPGDYPVGVAFPYMIANTGEAWAFHLVYLPTPRERRRFELRLQQETEAERWEQIGATTIAAMATRGDELTVIDFWLVSQFSSQQIGEFSERALRDWPERLLEPPTGGRQIGLQDALFSLIATRCESPTADRLLDAIAADQLQAIEPQREVVFWQALLAAAARPEEGAPADDAVLIRILRDFADRFPAADDAEEQPTTPLAAAAALLLERHGVDPADYGVEVVARRQLGRLSVAAPRGRIVSVPTARFTTEGALAEVLAWRKQLDEGSTAAATAAAPTEVY